MVSEQKLLPYKMF